MEWYEDEGFWELTYPLLFTPQRVAAGEEEVEKICRLVEFEGRHVLDLCCGPGRHSVPLARRGCSVTGVDRSPFLLAKARAYADSCGAAVEWVHEDMRHFVRPGAYDLVINMFTSFGYFGDREADRRVLENVRRNLHEGGVFVLDLMGKEILARRYESTSATPAADGSLLIEKHELLEDWSRLKTEWILVRGDTVRRRTLDLTLYSAVELRERLAASGFGDVRIFGDLDGGEYGAEAKRLIAVART